MVLPRDKREDHQNSMDEQGADGTSVGLLIATPEAVEALVTPSTTTLPVERVLVAAFVLTLTAVVFAQAWIMDDALITFRYATNALHGQGLVFNAGERVQGYTHPLWFVILTAGAAVKDDPVYVGVALGVALTALFALVTSLALLRRSRSTTAWVALLVAMGAILLSSDSWVSYQTGGLENSFSHLLLVLICVEVFRPVSRGFVVAGLSGLLFLSRPDFALVVGPLCLVTFFESRDTRSRAMLLVASLPVIAWLSFARLYYGDFLPNTANAKLGIYPSVFDAIHQGLRYTYDWFKYEPGSVLAAIALLALGFLLARSRREVAFGLGLVLYAVYVVGIGGDFMRGRFFLVVFVGSVLFGFFALARASWTAAAGARVAAVAVGVVLLLAFVVAPRQSNDTTSDGITNQRLFFAGYHLGNYIKNGGLTNDLADLDEARQLRRYADTCGPVAMHTGLPGPWGYLAGPKVTVIDMLGLTDNYIASLPRSTQVPGRMTIAQHPFKRVPVSYLAERGDISLFFGWMDAVRALDCSFKDIPPAFAASGLSIGPSGLLSPDGRTRISVTPPAVHTHEVVTLSAAGFKPDSRLRVLVNSFPTPVTIAVDASGGVTYTLALPAGLLPGKYTLTLIDDAGSAASAQVEITG